MGHINLTSNQTIKNIVMTADFIVAIIVTLYVLKFENLVVPRPNVLLIAVFVALVFAQSGFSTIIHHHRVSVDKILARTTGLAFTFGLILFSLVTLCKWTIGLTASGKAVGVITITVYLLLLCIRFTEHYALKLLRKQGRNTRGIVFVGMGDKLVEVVRDIDFSATSGLRFIGYYAPEENDELTRQMHYLGDYSNIEQLMDDGQRFADELYCALPPDEKRLSKRLIHHCMRHVTHFYYVPTFMGDMGEYLRPSMIGEQVVFANFTEPLLDPSKRMLKRTMDVVCSGLALLVLMWFLPIIAVIIKLSSPGPVFFRQARTGLGGRDFMMLKFRSMHVNNDADRIQATKDDPRKFPFGNFMRKTSIDELPQLWNIFVGDMSIVGPRPHMRKHTDEYSALIDDYMLRHYIRPGLTGWAQTTGFRGETQELWQMEGRVKKDVWYIQNWSFWLDVRIIFRTAKQVIWKDKQAY